MKKLICTLLFVIVGLFAVDRASSLVMRWVGDHTNDVLGPKLRYLHNTINEDVVLIGHSRCHHHYVPSILADSLGMSVYNAGVGGSNNIFSHYIVLRHILARYTPKVICLEVSPTDYCHQDDPFNVLSFFAPLYGFNEAADSVYHLAGKYWQYKVSHLYRYNAKAASNIIGLVLNRQTGNDNGYIPLPKPKQFPSPPAKEETVYDVDKLKMEYVQRFINLCKLKGIKLVFMASPKYTIVPSDYYDILKTVAKKNQVPFMDYHTSGLYHEHPEYFKDITHLWDEGARIYSSVFASDFKKILR